MSPVRRTAVVLLLSMPILLWTSTAVSDPLPVPVHIHSPSTVHTDGGSDLRLPPGYFLPESSWQQYDAETKRLQDAETRLNAENRSLKDSASVWQPGWRSIAAAFVVGTVTGAYLFFKL